MFMGDSGLQVGVGANGRRHRRSVLALVSALVLVASILVSSAPGSAQESVAEVDLVAELKVKPSSEGAVLSWVYSEELGADVDCPISRYVITIYEYADGEYETKANEYVDVPASGFEVTGLDPLTEYAAMLWSYSYSCKRYGRGSGVVAHFTTTEIDNGSEVSLDLGGGETTVTTTTTTTTTPPTTSTTTTIPPTTTAQNERPRRWNYISSRNEWRPQWPVGHPIVKVVPSSTGMVMTWTFAWYYDRAKTQVIEEEVMDTIDCQIGHAQVRIYENLKPEYWKTHPDGHMYFMGSVTKLRSSYKRVILEDIEFPGARFEVSNLKPLTQYRLQLHQLETSNCVLPILFTSFTTLATTATTTATTTIPPTTTTTTTTTTPTDESSDDDEPSGDTDSESDSDIVSVSAGGSRLCGLRANGTLHCTKWLGKNRFSESDTPEGIFTAVSVGYAHSCAVQVEAEIISCWGKNQYGQLNAPTNSGFVTVSAGRYHSCAIDAQHVVTCWGRNRDGEAEAPSGEFGAVSAGRRHTCGVLRNSGAVTCWGYNRDGRSDAPSGDFADVAAGTRHSCGLLTDGSIVCWGNNSKGQTDVPVGQYTAVSVGNWQSCGLRTDGTVACWGDGKYELAEPFRSTEYTAISVGRWHSCGIGTDGGAHCWDRKTR